VLGQVKQGSPDFDRIASEAARTVRGFISPAAQCVRIMLVFVILGCVQLLRARTIRALPHVLDKQSCPRCGAQHNSRGHLSCCTNNVQIPGRENGGNCDIKNLSKGCKVYFPVFVEGANLSMGDMHFSQASRARPTRHAAACPTALIAVLGCGALPPAITVRPC